MNKEADVKVLSGEELNQATGGTTPNEAFENSQYGCGNNVGQTTHSWPGPVSYAELQ